MQAIDTVNSPAYEMERVKHNNKHNISSDGLRIVNISKWFKSKSENIDVEDVKTHESEDNEIQKEIKKTEAHRKGYFRALN